jgi:hypothetical protein
MATEKQFEANRQNAQKSTGPKTPEGRAAARLNGVKHGLTAETIVLKGESQADFTNLFDSLEAEHDPVTPTEEALVVQLAMATWRLRRLYHAEAGFWAFKMKDTVDSRKEPKLNDSERMGYVAYLSPATLVMFNRQENRLERTFYRALHELQSLRKERESSLALVSQETPVGQVPDLPSSETNDIQPPPPAAAPPEPTANPAEAAETAAHPVPEAADMQ